SSNAKMGSLTRYFKENSDRVAEAATAALGMAEMESLPGSQPHSPYNSECSTHSAEKNDETDIRQLITNLPSKDDIQLILGKLEVSFQKKMEEMGSDVQQLNLRVTDLEEERDVLQAQITNIATTLDSHIQF
ncbi:Hypothetical predicted protein, partial [Pelobates cultripes]